jgi:Family of unknown function (DUF6941)
MSETGIERPFCVAIVICNEVIEDKTTSNKTLVSCFNTIGAPGLPCQHPRMFVMASMTDGRGRWPVTFRITGPSGPVIMQVQGEAHFANPLDVVDLVLQVRGLQLTEEGEHRVEVLIGGVPRASRRFSVVVQQEGAEG